MQFQVPQFIDVKPKIVGPLTLRQFLYIAGAAVPSFILFFILQFFLWFILTVILSSAALSLAFVKIKGQPLVKVLLAAFNYFWKPRFYIWKRAEEIPGAPELPERPKRAPLKDLFLKLTTTTRPIEKREKPSKLFTALRRTPKEAFEVLRKTTGEREKARRVDYR